MAQLTLRVPSCRTVLKIFLILLVLAGFGASGTFITLGFIAVQDMRHDNAATKARVHWLEHYNPTVTPMPTATPNRIELPPTSTPQPTATPMRMATPQPTATPMRMPTPQPTATPTMIRHLPTATPIRLPPTPTAIALPTPGASWNDVYRDLRRSVVYLVDPNRRSSGSGWVYENGYLLTAAHVVGNFKWMTVWYEDAHGNNQEVRAQTVGSDQLRDLAVLRLPATDLRPITGRKRLGTRDTGITVMSMGFSSGSPIGWPNIRLGGLTTLYVTSQHELAVLETDAAFDPGDSGGPILNAQGEVIGMAQASHQRSTGGSAVRGRQLAITIKEIEEVWVAMKNGQAVNSGYGHWFEWSR